MKFEKTLNQLRMKSEGNGRMPSIKNIHLLLEHYKIEHSFSDSQNVVEYRTAGRNYVNSRHVGKKGFELTIDRPYINLDTSDSYYSWNSWQYAQKIVELIDSL
jgi:hypothetical protein